MVKEAEDNKLHFATLKRKRIKNRNKIIPIFEFLSFSSEYKEKLRKLRKSKKKRVSKKTKWKEYEFCKECPAIKDCKKGKITHCDLYSEYMHERDLREEK